MTELRKTQYTTLTVDDLPDPAAGGGCHVYSVSTVGGPSQTIMFQHGPIKDAGANGLQNEDLLAMVEHRLKCFQRGPFASTLNHIALTHVRAALSTLEYRTALRGAAGVEGTNSPAATVEGALMADNREPVITAAVRRVVEIKAKRLHAWNQAMAWEDGQPRANVPVFLDCTPPSVYLAIPNTPDPADRHRCVALSPGCALQWLAFLELGSMTEAQLLDVARHLNRMAGCLRCGGKLIELDLAIDGAVMTVCKTCEATDLRKRWKPDGDALGV